MLKTVPAILAGTTKTVFLHSDCIVVLFRSHYCSVYFKIDLNMLKTEPGILAGTSPLTLMHSLLLFRCTQLVYWQLTSFWALREALHVSVYATKWKPMKYGLTKCKPVTHVLRLTSSLFLTSITAVLHSSVSRRKVLRFNLIRLQCTHLFSSKVDLRWGTFLSTLLQLHVNDQI